jgi:hypothetical protein
MLSDIPDFKGGKDKYSGAAKEGRESVDSKFLQG